MEKSPVRQLSLRLCLLTLVLGVTGGCQRKTETAAPGSPAPGSKNTSVQAKPFATPISGPLTPALVTQAADSITHYLHFPKDPEIAKLNDTVQFYCDVTDTGSVESTDAVVGKNPAFEAAVQTALDWGRFAPAMVNGNPVPVYLSGTVLFGHRNEQELIIVSLATYDRERVTKFANYIQPQLVGGLRQTMQKALAEGNRGNISAGQAEVVVKVDASGKVTDITSVSENPRDSGLAQILNDSLRQSQFTPAYENGKAATGAINVVADFSQF
ncbi:MAG TPA: energy transducer TonB [Chthoniobacterales bacterium]|jgi:hypothetical protein